MEQLWFQFVTFSFSFISTMRTWNTTIGDIGGCNSSYLEYRLDTGFWDLLYYMLLLSIGV